MSGHSIKLPLAALDTVRGIYRYLLGADGLFTDIDGHDWVGSHLFTVPQLEAPIDGLAPSGAVTLSYFQDPGGLDLIAEVQALGLSFIAGRPIRFYTQTLQTSSEFAAPTLAPRLIATRIMRDLTYEADGPDMRQITLSFEAVTEERRATRRRAYNTADHAALLGAANPSLEFMPTTAFQEEPLFG